MLKCNNQIRLNQFELLAFRIDTGVMTPPTTVEEYNKARQDAADYWRRTDLSPEGQFLAALIEGEKLPCTSDDALSSKQDGDTNSGCKNVEGSHA